MWTETFFQLADRMIIERLKQERFKEAGKQGKSNAARSQADALEAACGELLMEFVDGKTKPQMAKHLRFHNHDIAAEPLPDSMMGCISELSITHARYWEAQTHVQNLKDKLCSGNGDQPGYLKRFHELQLKIDEYNQRRNEVRERGDAILVEMFNAT